MSSKTLEPTPARPTARISSPRALWRFFVRRDTPLLPKLTALLALAYVIWPADLLPDVAPFLGWLDDVGFVAFATGWLARAMRKAQAEDEAAAAAADKKRSGRP